MIFHIGKLVEVGHYVYYSKIGRKRWVEFNDENTSEFDLDQEDEEFEKEFKAEKTPYILFYQRIA
jgi:ubiquitin C-terminal hydrolase